VGCAAGRAPAAGRAAAAAAAGAAVGRAVAGAAAAAAGGGSSGMGMMPGASFGVGAAAKRDCCKLPGRVMPVTERGIEVG
jgi:hypothetical protein